MPADISAKTNRRLIVNSLAFVVAVAVVVVCTLVYYPVQTVAGQSTAMSRYAIRLTGKDLSLSLDAQDIEVVDPRTQVPCSCLLFK